MTNSIPKVAAGQKIKASTVNSLIDRVPILKVQGDGSVVEHGGEWNIEIGDKGKAERSGQTYRLPFDLSCGSDNNALTYVVLRPELYLWGSHRTIKDNDLKVSFPTEDQQHVGIYISCDAGCSPESYGLAVMEAATEIHFTDVVVPSEQRGLQPKAAITDTRQSGTLDKPNWATTKGTLREYWADGSSLKNPSWSQDGHSLQEPSWRDGSSIENPTWGPSNKLTEKWIKDNPENAAQVINLPGGATQQDVQANNASDYDDSGEKYASSPHAWLIWSFLPNGTILEDSRNMAIPAAEDMYFKATRPTKLDLSSLSWKVDYPTDPLLSAKYAQTFHYHSLEAEDKVDLKTIQNGQQTSPEEISCAIDQWRFLVRPEGGGTLHYASLSTCLSAISASGGGGGGGGCSCDLSVTPPSTLSSLNQELVQIADWTKDGWRTHIPILAPDTAKDIVTMANRLAYTPFYLRIRHINGQVVMDIINNFFFYGREMKTLQGYSVTQTGTYYLEIQTNQYGYYISHIVREPSTSIPPAVKQNDDTHTYYPLWVVTSINPTWDNGFPFDCRSMYITPFYSN